MLDPVIIVDAMISHAVSDLGQSPGGVLHPVLAAYGLTLDLSDDPSYLGERVGLKYLERPVPSDGVCIQFTPLPWTEERSGVPDVAQKDFTILIKCTLKDYPGNPLTGAVGRMGRFMTQMAAALQTLYGPASLGATDGGWTIGDDVLLNPMCGVADPASEAEIKDQAVIFCELEFNGYEIFSTP